MPEATPEFDKYIDTLSNHNKEKILLSYEWTGAVLSNIRGWRMKKSLFYVGPGDSGKSVHKALVERILGQGNFVGIDLSEIEARFGTGVIYDTRLSGSSDMSFMTVSELKTFKKLTGGDSVFAEFKGQQGFEYTYNGLLWFCMNKLPKFGGDDGKWVYDRILVFKCPNTIPKDEQDKQLIDKLYEERNGIIYKSVKALQKVIANGYRFDEPEEVTDAREEYMNENNTVVSFFEECMCEWDLGKERTYCTTGRIFKAYQEWCRDNNNGFAKTAKEFREKLADYLGGTFQDITVRLHGNTYYKDYRLTTEALIQYDKEYKKCASEFTPIPPL